MNNIIIKEKEDNISWEEIRSCLIAAHAENFSNGIVMKNPSLPASEIEKKIKNENGKMYVAMDGDKVIGTAAYSIRRNKVWFCQSEYINLCFVAILPNYGGRGIYKALHMYIEKERERLNLPLLVFDTHENNKRMIKINERNGFRKVDYKRCGDHCNVMMAKWVGRCPYSSIYIYYKYWTSYVSVCLKSYLMYFLRK